ncbi:MAG: peptidoglycan-binding domain-containing protein [Candidatus Paceibacterota bacterium]
MKKYLLGLLLIVFIVPSVAFAHRSGCHRWHSCPSDTGSYVQGDAGYISQYPTYKDGVTTYPDNPFYRTEYGGTKYTTPGYYSFSTTTYSYQTKLIKLGYLAEGQADGKKGPKTTSAVRQFQKDNGLVSDGLIGPITIKALNSK